VAPRLAVEGRCWEEVFLLFFLSFFFLFFSRRARREVFFFPFPRYMKRRGDRPFFIIERE